MLTLFSHLIALSLTLLYFVCPDMSCLTLFSIFDCFAVGAHNLPVSSILSPINKCWASQVQFYILALLRH